MKNYPAAHFGPLARTAFTLIELLVVMAVIGILAALIFPVTKGIKDRQMKSVARAELHDIETAINSYHANARLGSYPPDHPGDPLINGLYFELEGTVRSGGGPDFATLDGSGKISAVNAQTYFGVGGFANSSTSAQGTDDAPAPVNLSAWLEAKPDRRDTRSHPKSKSWSARWAGRQIGLPSRFMTKLLRTRSRSRKESILGATFRRIPQTTRARSICGLTS